MGTARSAQVETTRGDDVICYGKAFLLDIEFGHGPSLRMITGEFSRWIQRWPRTGAFCVQGIMQPPASGGSLPRNESQAALGRSLKK